MQKKNITSLRQFRAQRIYDNYQALPMQQRTNARAALLLEAIFDYAYENVPKNRRFAKHRVRVSQEESQRISERLEEFLPRSDSGEPIMHWLHENMIPEAWAYPEDRRMFIRECLRR